MHCTPGRHAPAQLQNFERTSEAERALELLLFPALGRSVEAQVLKKRIEYSTPHYVCSNSELERIFSNF